MHVEKLLDYCYVLGLGANCPKSVADHRKHPKVTRVLQRITDNLTVTSTSASIFHFINLT